MFYANLSLSPQVNLEWKLEIMIVFFNTKLLNKPDILQIDILSWQKSHIKNVGPKNHRHINVRTRKNIYIHLAQSH